MWQLFLLMVVINLAHNLKEKERFFMALVCLLLTAAFGFLKL